MTLNLILEIIVAVMLGAAVWYSILLNNRLANFRAGQDELSDLIKGLNDAVASARESVAVLNKSGKETGEALGIEIDRARLVRDELDLITGSATNAADRLEKRLGEVRGNLPSIGPVAIAAARADVPTPGTGSGAGSGAEQSGAELGEAEEAILRALSGVR